MPTVPLPAGAGSAMPDAAQAPVPDAAQTVVIGAGIAGLCTALYLRRAGREVVVVDRGEPWGESSGANAGTLSLQVKRPEVWHLARLAIDLWERLGPETGEDLGFARPGGLRVATTAAELDSLAAVVKTQQRHGLDVELWQGLVLRERAPALGPAVVAAAWCPHDAMTSPLSAGPGLLRAVRIAGSPVLGHAGVEAIEGRDGNFRVLTARGAVRARTLVIAAGCWSDRVAALLGVRVPVMVDVNMLTVTETAAPVLDRVVTHAGGVLSLKQYANGTVAIGGGWQGRGGVDPDRREVDYENLLHNLRTAAQVVPALAGLRVLRAWAGFEGVAPDALPLFGPLPGFGHAYLLACARGGYALGPAQGLLMAELITRGRARLDTRRFAPARFAA